jgi:hypothetical protein
MLTGSVTDESVDIADALTADTPGEKQIDW